MTAERRPPRPPLAYRAMQAMMWPILKVLRITCKDVFELCAGQMDREISRGEAIRLRLHLMICGMCRRLPAQFTGMREWIRCAHSHAPEETGDECLSPETKERITARLRDDARDSP